MFYRLLRGCEGQSLALYAKRVSGAFMQADFFEDPKFLGLRVSLCSLISVTIIDKRFYR
jgi:hypothetical protein